MIGLLQCQSIDKIILHLQQVIICQLLQGKLGTCLSMSLIYSTYSRYCFCN